MNYFPTFLAYDEAFCNRVKETKRLIHNIEMHTPMLIMSPRRYGKTSLVLNAVKKKKLIYSHIDFYKELSEEGIERAILSGVGNLVGELESRPKQLLNLASEFFSDLGVRVIVEKVGMSLDFSRNKKTPAENIQLALEKLQQLAKKKNKRVVIFLDEFQIIGEVAKSHAIEAAIRHMAQQPEYISYVFSGSNRRLLHDMFYDKKRPLYKLCDMLSLERMLPADYYPHFDLAAQETWGRKLDKATMDLILNITERHPYYVNKLCSLVWQGEFPVPDLVNQCWDDYGLENQSVTARELELLSLNQRKLLIGLSNNPLTKEPHSSDFAYKIGVSSGSISQAIQALIKRDYIYIDTDGYYRILDPLIRHVLSS